MGQMRFRAPSGDRPSPQALDRAYLAGIEGLPWRCRSERRGNELVIQWPGNESGNLFLPWRVEGHGELLLSTASLMLRDEAYQLALELARGGLSRLRNHRVECESRGFQPPLGFDDRVQSAMHHFVRSATCQSDPEKCAEEAEQSLQFTLSAAEQLGESSAIHAAQQRRAGDSPPGFFLGGAIDAAPPDELLTRSFVSAFEWAAVPLAWRDVEPEAGRLDWSKLDRQVQWCRDNGLKICGGPLLRLDHACLPDWVFRLSSFEALQSRVFHHADHTIRKYQGQVRLWHTSAGMNTGGAAPLSEEQKLRLAVTVIEAAQRADPGTPMMISFDQPMCEYLAHQDSRLSPMDFADALVRADMGVAALGLEINLGYWPEGSLPRDMLQMSRQLDRWGSLGLPLLVLLTAPSGEGEDRKARRPARPLSHAFPSGPSLESQAAVVRRLTPQLISKPFIEGLIWAQLSDAAPHAFPHGGAADANGRPKPVLDALASIRQGYLM